MTAWTHVARAVGPALLKSLAATWRYREADSDDNPLPRRRRLDPAVYALWHAELLPLMLGYAPGGIVAMISHHADGDIASAILESLGGVVVRGSSSTGGGEALQQMIRYGREGRPLAITPDGPRGPARVSKPGVVKIASRSGLPVVPVAARPASGWRLRSWDRFMVPCPFTTIHVEFAPSLDLPADLEEEAIHAWTSRIDEAISAASRRVARRAGANAA